MKLAQKTWKLGQVTASSPAVLLIHANKFCKEIWQPVVEHLSRLCNSAGQSAKVIAVDVPGCGDSRPINFSLPADWPKECLPGLREVVAEHGRDGRPLFGVGHSVGGSLVMSCEADQPGTFTRLLAYEPFVVPPDFKQPSEYTEEQRQVVMDMPIIRSVRDQKTAFQSRAAAFRYYRSVKRFELIPDEVLWIFVQHGMEDIPDMTGHAQLKQNPSVEIDRYLGGLHIVTDDDLTAMQAPCVFGYGSLSDWGEMVIGEDTAKRIRALAQQFSHNIAPWVVPGATHLQPLEKAKTVAGHIQRLVWYETVQADKDVPSKL